MFSWQFSFWHMSMEATPILLSLLLVPVSSTVFDLQTHDIKAYRVMCQAWQVHTCFSAWCRWRQLFCLYQHVLGSSKVEFEVIRSTGASSKCGTIEKMLDCRLRDLHVSTATRFHSVAYPFFMLLQLSTSFTFSVHGIQK